MNQLSIPIEVRPEEVERKHSLGGAIELCAELGGYDLHSLRRRETEIERENRLMREEIAALRRVIGRPA